MPDAGAGKAEKGYRKAAGRLQLCQYSTFLWNECRWSAEIKASGAYWGRRPLCGAKISVDRSFLHHDS